MAKRVKRGGASKKFLLEIPEKIWEDWKNTIPRSISLNEALIQLLEKEGKNEKS